MVEKHDIIFKILHELTPFDPIRDSETSDIMLNLLSTFFRCSHSYYNDYYNSLANQGLYLLPFFANTSYIMDGRKHSEKNNVSLTDVG